MDNQSQSGNRSPEGGNLPPKTHIRKSNNSLAVVLLSVLITALVVGGAVFAWQNSKLNQVKEQNQSKIETLQKQINKLESKLKNEDSKKGTNQDESSQEDEEDLNTSNWESYKNQKYGFQFKYTSNFTVEKVETTAAKSLKVKSSSEINGGWRFSVVENEKQLSAKQLVEKIDNWGAPEVKNKDVKDVEDLKIGSVDGKKVTMDLLPTDAGSKTRNTTYIYLTPGHAKYYYVLEFDNKIGSQKRDSKFFDRMLSTFSLQDVPQVSKLPNITMPSTGEQWKIGNNYNIEWECPKDWQDGNFDIYATNDSGLSKIVGSKVSCSSEAYEWKAGYDWQGKKVIPSGNNYKVVFRSVAGASGKIDQSSSFILIE